MNPIKVFKSLMINASIFLSSAYTVNRVYSKYYGVKIGTNSRFTGKKVSFGSEPFLISIGDNVTITPGVKFQTHDGGVGLFRKEYPGINVFGRIEIGNNVFIGEDAMIMYGVKIGDNVVVGARSVVTKDVPSNVVVVGVPARILKTLEEYKETSLKKAIFINEKDEEARKNSILVKLS